MTKIENYKRLKGIAVDLAKARDHTLGLDSPNNDKHIFLVEFTGIGLRSNWSPMLFSIEAAYGYYGSSSGYSASSKELGAYLARAISRNAKLLLDLAVSLAEADAEKARKEAETEAREVLVASSTLPTAEVTG